MKAATGSFIDVLQERTERLRRDRAATRALRVVFPALEEVRLELRFDRAGSSGPARQVHIMHPPARAFFQFPCPRADCSGRFDLSAAVTEASANQSKRSGGVILCAGVRPRTYDSKQPCALQLFYGVIAKEYATGG